jgi:hypothetical protein
MQRCDFSPMCNVGKSTLRPERMDERIDDYIFDLYQLGVGPTRLAGASRGQCSYGQVRYLVKKRLDEILQDEKILYSMLV